MTIFGRLALIAVIAISTIAILSTHSDDAPSQSSKPSPPQANAAASAKRPPGDLREILLDNEVAYSLSRSRDAVLRQLRDPASAQFRNVAVVRAKQGLSWAFCGEVNAKNGFGGYTGFVPFYTVAESAYVLGNDRIFERMFKLYCVEGTPVRMVSFD
jgi:hypothetical protein